MKLEELGSALQEIGPTMEPMNITEYVEEMTIVLTFEDETVIFIERDENRETLVFVGRLGKPPADEVNDLNAIFMRMNTLWGPLGGLRFALEDEGEYMVFLDLPYGPLTTEILRGFIGGFVERTRYWKSAVTKGAPELPGDADPDEMESMIRA